MGKILQVFEVGPWNSLDPCPVSSNAVRPSDPSLTRPPKFGSAYGRPPAVSALKNLSGTPATSSDQKARVACGMMARVSANFLFVATLSGRCLQPFGSSCVALRRLVMHRRVLGVSQPVTVRARAGSVQGFLALIRVVMSRCNEP